MIYWGKYVIIGSKENRKVGKIWVKWVVCLEFVEGHTPPIGGLRCNRYFVTLIDEAS